jgi:hypothetical protein
MRLSDGVRNLVRNYLNTHRHDSPEFVLTWDGNRPYLYEHAPMLDGDALDEVFKETCRRMKRGPDYVASVFEGKRDGVYNLSFGTWS